MAEPTRLWSYFLETDSKSPVRFSRREPIRSPRCSTLDGMVADKLTVADTVPEDGRGAARAGAAGGPEPRRVA
ncbi:hypothetical protein GCM10018785_66630 [Streptomyces longispororuber]|uniref:Uncharacterized protein n=1 Tax=Streptomyces longispororuber TaxID=68230 RepID=A0A919DYC0_9ACTN|nr:hypothetical protein GCM10018785_66630 [Streptomyces longispororuber]